MTGIEPTFALPSEAELALRLAKLREKMAVHSIDCYLSMQVDNVFYLTNFANYVHERPFVLVITAEGPIRFLVPKLEAKHVEMRAIGPIELVDYFEYPAPLGHRWNDRLRALIPTGAKIAVESQAPLFLWQALDGAVTIEDLIDDLRMVKSSYELSRIQHASTIASKFHTDFLMRVSPGISLAAANGEVGKAILTKLLMEDPKLNLFATKINFGFQPPSISWDPHNFTDLSMQTEVGGPNVSLLNGVMNGYGTEVERTFFLGHVPEEAKRPFDLMLEARRVAMESARPGVLMGEVDRLTNEVFHKAGMTDFLLHRTGHGIGVTGHEGPFLAEGYDRELVPGMVLTIEPGIYVPSLGGFRHSDTIYIGENGAEPMTSGPITREELTFPV